MRRELSILALAGLAVLGCRERLSAASLASDEARADGTHAGTPMKSLVSCSKAFQSGATLYFSFLVTQPDRSELTSANVAGRLEPVTKVGTVVVVNGNREPMTQQTMMYPGISITFTPKGCRAPQGRTGPVVMTCGMDARAETPGPSILFGSNDPTGYTFTAENGQGVAAMPPSAPGALVQSAPPMTGFSCALSG